MFDWNDLRYFLELQRSGRLLTAAKRLNTTHSTVARHIESIEQHLGTALFVQHAQGYQLTPAGQALLKHAEAMENVALLAQEEITQAITPLGKIRLGVTEGIGIMFIASRLRGLFERYPGLEVELVAVPRFVSILAQQQAARAGLGIAVLPNYMASHDPQLVRVLPEESVQRSYWISTRRELHKSVRLRVVWDFLLELCREEQGVLLAV